VIDDAIRGHLHQTVPFRCRFAEKTREAKRARAVPRGVQKRSRRQENKKRAAETMFQALRGVKAGRLSAQNRCQDTKYEEVG